MALKFAVAPGTIILCDYSLGGFKPPEMVKRRPAIVVSPRLPHRDGLCSVVPLSTSHDGKARGYVVEIRLIEALPPPFSSPLMWAKCDMVATVSYERLDLFRTKRDHAGRRHYLHPRLNEDDFDRIKVGILHGLGLTLT